MPDCVPLSSCRMDSSSVTTFSSDPDECGLSVGDWSGSVRAEGSCSRGATRPGPGTQGQRLRLHNQPGRHVDGTETHTHTHTPLRLTSKANSLECDSLLARMNMTTWLCVCSEMSLPLMSTTRSPSMSLGSHRPACEEAVLIK